MTLLLLFTMISCYAMYRVGRMEEVAVLCGMSLLTMYFIREDIHIDKVIREQDKAGRATKHDWDSY